MCSCEGVCISVVVRGFAGKSVPFNYPSGSAVHYGQQVVIVARAWLKYAPVTSLARGRHRDDSLWWRSVWQYDWRSCPAPSRFHVVRSCHSVYFVFSVAVCGTTDQSEEHLDVHRSSLRRVSLAARFPVLVLSLEVLVCTLHFGGRRFSDKCTHM